MPLNLNDIHFNAQAGRDAATNVGDAATNLTSACADGFAILEDLRGEWTGSNATDYAAGVEGLLEELQKRAKSLEEISQAMYQTANLYEQEQTAQYYRDERAREEAREEAKKAKKAKKSKKK